MISFEAREEMPAHEFEVEEAEREGIRFVHRRGPARILTEEGKVVGVETIGVRSVFDEEGRFDPRFDTSDRETYPADTIILAVGQAVDVGALGEDGQRSAGGTIAVDPSTLATSLPGVWAGGDAAHGPRSLIEAIADGRRVAPAIHRSLGGADDPPAPGQMEPVSGFHRLDDRYDRVDRLPVPLVDSPTACPTEDGDKTPTRARPKSQDLGHTDDPGLDGPELVEIPVATPTQTMPVRQ